MESKTRILVVEDEKLLRKNVVKKLESLSDLGIVVAGEAMDGKSAYAMIPEVHPDIILTDIRMPVMDGLELIRNAEQFYPDIIYIILSSYSDFEYARKAISLQVSDYLLKPVKLEELRNALLSAIAKRMQNAPLPLPDKELNRRNVAQKLADFIKLHYKEQISLSQLSEKFGYSVEYLGKMFKEEMKMTPSDYITCLRIENAKHMLLNCPDMDIYKVAKLSGYGENCYYFSRMFKLKTGLRPSEFRKNGGV
jgi:Response regulator containing CheY-like receiver domain and AraC-type DNA-binding domain